MALLPDRVHEFSKLGQAIRQAMRELYDALQGRLTMHDNVKRLVVTKTFGAVADTSTDVDISALALTWTPTRVTTLEVNDGAVVYAASTAHTGWTNLLIKMKSSKANTIWIGEVE